MSEKKPHILEFFKAVGEVKASDLYLTVGFAPAMRTSKGLEKIREEPLTVDEINDVINSILTSRQRREFDTKMELNTSVDVRDYGRYRVNILKQRQNPALVLRRIVSKIPNFEELKLPSLLGEMAILKRGLVLVTGPTGSGKSTSLASMVDYRNTNEQGHIITIEDPIEYFYEHKKSIMTQREVGVDTESYAIALKNALRQRPDVILIGEIRDREVMEQVLTASETGHLCLATMHTSNAYQSIDRIVNMFPEEYHDQIRLNLAMNLRGIVSQRLVPAAAGGLTVALEIMINRGLIKELILKGEISKIREVMEQNTSQGMITFDLYLLKLWREGLITEDVALSNADQAGDLKIKMQQGISPGGTGGSGLHAMDVSRIQISDD